MRIGAAGAYRFAPYVYNTNTVGSASLNRLSRISDDVLDKKIDYSELADDTQNINPLQKGQTVDFQSLLEMQMQRGRNNASRIMKPVQETQTKEDETVQKQTAEAAPEQTFSSEQTAAWTGNRTGEDSGSAVPYQMQQAINAYEMFMTA